MSQQFYISKIVKEDILIILAKKNGFLPKISVNQKMNQK